MNWLATGEHAVLSLCSGYGGLELALQRVLPTSYVGTYCENYGPAQQVLQAHNPRVDVLKDVRDPELLNLKAPIVTFGFPCQDLSVAGKQAGLDGERSGLFHTCMAVVDMGWGRSAQEWRDWTGAMRERHSNGNGRAAAPAGQRRRPRSGRARDLGRTERTGLRDGSTPGFSPGVFPYQPADCANRCDSSAASRSSRRA